MSYFVDVNTDGFPQRIVINTIDPLTGHKDDPISIFGQNFYAIDKVRFDQVEADFTVIDDGQIIAYVPTSAGSGNIFVESQSRQSTGEFNGPFIPFPRISSFTPLTGVSQDQIIIKGNNFSGVSGVLFNNIQSSSITVVDNTGVYATVPDGNSRGFITLQANSGVSTDTSDEWKLHAVFQSVTPSSGQVDTPLVIGGSGFYSTTLIEEGSSTYLVGFGGEDITANFAINSTTQLTGNVPSGAASGFLYVYDNDGSVRQSDVTFNILHSAPVLDALAPSSGISGQYVSVSGRNLFNINAVTVSGASLNPISAFNQDTGNGLYINFNIPNISEGTYSIVASGDQGDSTLANAYTVLGNPTISSIVQSSGCEGDEIQLNGTNLYQHSKIYLNHTGVQAQVVSGNDSDIYFTLPTLTGTGVNFIIDNGVSTDTSSQFRGILSPSIGFFTPISGTFNDTIVISGQGFDLIQGVKIGNTSISNSSYTVTNLTGIEVTLPSNAQDGVITISGFCQSDSSTGSFNFLNGPITISGFDPNTGFVNSNTIVGSGINLDKTSYIEFSGRSSNTVYQYTFGLAGSTGIEFLIPTGVEIGQARPLVFVDIEGRSTQTSESLTVTDIEVPYISGFHPTGGSTGSYVLISGSGMNSITNFYMNGIESTFSSITIGSTPVISGIVPAITPWPQNILVKVSSSAGSSETGDFNIYAHNPNFYENINLISPSYDSPSQKTYIEVVDQGNGFGAVMLQDILGTGHIISTFVG